MPETTNIPQDVLDRLAPDYRDFIISIGAKPTGLAGLEWSPALRPPPAPSAITGMNDPVPVGSQRTISLGTYSVQVMTPPGDPPTRGWPVLVFAHWGGFVFGHASEEDGLMSRICVDLECVVVSVEYRLAPEHPFPAGLEDCWSALVWVHTHGKQELQIDPNRIAVMGTSAGANLTAAVAQRAALATPKIPLVLQILIIPCIDQSFTDDRTRWRPAMIENEHNFSLSVADLTWLRDLYLPNVEDRTNPEASPLLQPDKRAFEGMAPAWIGVAELDIIRSEGEEYADLLKEHGVPATLRTLKGLTHPGFVAERVCEEARAGRQEQIQALREAFV